MKIMIAEDDIYKERSITEYLLSEFNLLAENIVVTRSKEDAISALQAQNFDFIFLDMSLPRYFNDKDDIKHLAGKDILIFMRHRRKYVPTLVVTQHDVFGHHDSQISIENLRKELVSDFNRFLYDVVSWGSSEQWKDVIKKYFMVTP